MCENRNVVAAIRVDAYRIDSASLLPNVCVYLCELVSGINPYAKIHVVRFEIAQSPIHFY